MAADVRYQNVPHPPMQGRAEAQRFIAPILRETQAIEFLLVKLVAAEEAGLVLTERVDRLKYPSGVIDIPLMGVFEVRDGRITEWRDYADSATVARGFQNAGVQLMMDPAE